MFTNRVLLKSPTCRTNGAENSTDRENYTRRDRQQREGKKMDQS